MKKFISLSEEFAECVDLLILHRLLNIIMVRMKSDSSMRWFILFLNCLLMFAVYYCKSLYIINWINIVYSAYDIPAAMKSQLEDYMG